MIVFYEGLKNISRALCRLRGYLFGVTEKLLWRNERGEAWEKYLKHVQKQMKEEEKAESPLSETQYRKVSCRQRGLDWNGAKPVKKMKKKQWKKASKWLSAISDIMAKAGESLKEENDESKRRETYKTENSTWLQWHQCLILKYSWYIREISSFYWLHKLWEIFCLYREG